ncbi:MAG: alpha-ketoglutarate-dependent dioxygenase AlkB [Chloroflexales bacterium]|nr:alpha-ketoglutarate-dependent dioxygenase AlkB [Chloroflexales bacterium]
MSSPQGLPTTTIPPAAIPGLTYVPDYIAPDAATVLLQQIDQQPWDATLRRRVQHYGYRYDYQARTVTSALRAAAFPPWLQNLACRLHQEGFATALPDQGIVNEYLPGQGIAKHIDCIPCFGATILSVSLGSGCEMRLTTPAAKAVASLWLAPGSLLVLCDAARYQWAHGIPARQSDRYAGQRVPRQRRVSLTFRTVLLNEG